ncbi:MAG: hypothetical protein A2959_03400 [Candidatus Levybacteria bacterium RIFCSPLOWO2_01_FULL_38_23]|nr:MAG: hypothetical protein A2959_03400 [Candidatus Levybacteria bacterium RIFCSPLOWO2_01_FULL_38_23]
MKVCFITNYAYRLFNQKSQIAFGGIETIFYLIAKDLIRDKRFKASFLLEDDVNKRSATEKINGITLYKTSRQVQPKHYHDRQVEKYNRWFSFWAGKFEWLWQLPHLDFFRLWERLKQIDADVYVFASPGYESSLITLVTKLIRKKSVYIAANDELLAKNYSLFFLLRYADRIICYSPRHQEILKKKYGIKAVYLPPWFPRPKKALSLKQRKYCLWVGRIEARKRPETFIKLAKSLPDLNFLMIMAAAPGEQGLLKSITASAAKLPNLKLKQDESFAKLDHYYRRARAFIDTSDYKNLNMTQVQAAYFKLPCMTLFYDPNDSFRDYSWGLTAHGNIQKLKKNILAVFKSEKLWKSLSENGFKFADTVYNREVNLRVFKDLILKLSR